MKLGLETESCHLFFQNGKMNIFEFIQKTADLGLNGVMINIIAYTGDKYLHPKWGVLSSNEEDYLIKVRKEIQRHGLFSEIDTRGTDPQHLAQVIRIAHILGSDVIRTYCCQGSYDKVLLKQAPKDLKKIVPLLKKYRIKLAIENHEEETSDEIIEIIREVNSYWVGAHFDFGNSMMAWEDPVEAAKKLAPYIYTTHFKDHIIIKDGEEYKICGVPAGQGNINLDKIFHILVEESPVRRINIEMCYPYVASFKREVGTGGVFEVGKGAFKVEEAPFYSQTISPSNYYYPLDKDLDYLMDQQIEGLKISVEYAKKLRDKYCR